VDRYLDLEESKHSRSLSPSDDIREGPRHNASLDGEDASDWEEVESKSNDVSDEVKKLIEELTKGYTLKFTDVRDKQELRESPLNTLTLEMIKRLIRNGRDRVRRIQKPPKVSTTSGGAVALSGKKRHHTESSFSPQPTTSAKR